MTGSAPLVSVVTPVYNGARYIVQCVESVLAQTYENFEYIVVDNCSSDATPDIVQRYADRDSRVRLERAPEFVSQRENANRALRLISAESAYTKEIHADDWLHPNCIEEMVAVARPHPNVGLVGAYRLLGSTVDLDSLPVELTVVPGRDVCRAHLLGRPWGYLFGSPSSVLYRSDLVRARSEFYKPTSGLVVDQEACLHVLSRSDFGFVHQVLTYTRRHPEAASSYLNRLCAKPAGQLELLIEYGPQHLTNTEYRRRVAAWTFLYLWALMRHAGRARSRDFRAFHSSFIAEALRSITIRDVALGTVYGLRRRYAKVGPSRSRRSSDAP